VESGSVAQAAGVLPGDIVRSFGGAAITQFQQLQQAVATARPGPQTMDIERAEKLISLTVTLK
jgi:S1-C subfamily serine protease